MRRRLQLKNSSLVNEDQRNSWDLSRTSGHATREGKRKSWSLLFMLSRPDGLSLITHACEASPYGTKRGPLSSGDEMTKMQKKKTHANG